jgi:hypothetical protein
MHVVHPICCGLDVHPASVVTCLRCVGDDGQMRLERREYGTTHSWLGKEMISLSPPPRRTGRAVG